MNEVADLEPGDVLGRLAPETLQRFVDLACKAIGAPASMILTTSADAGRTVRAASGFDLPSRPIEANGHDTTATGVRRVTDLSRDGNPDAFALCGFAALAYVEIALHQSSGRDIGTLFVMDRAPRSWSDTEIDLLQDIAIVLESQIDARNELLADVNRELRAPMQAVIGFTDLLKAEREPDLVAHHIRSIQAAADDLLALLDELPVRAGQSKGEAPLEVPVDDPDQLHSDAGGLRILLADDLDLNRKLVADMLGTDGHKVDCVADGSEAVRAASQRPYDLILMDMIMPGMDGIAATRAIRALPGPAARTPIVALTANSFHEQLDICLEAGMDATLTKPMSLEALTTAVRTWTRTGSEGPPSPSPQ